MADSDDEYDRKRRDKFRGERSSGGENFRAERRGDDRGRREDWQDRNPFRGAGSGAGGVGRGRADYRDFRGPRERYSPGREFPAPKRLRPDWGDEMRHRYADPYGMYNWGPEAGYPMHGMHVFGGGGLPPPAPHAAREGGMNGDVQTQPSMMTLKQFLDTQDDGISDSEVLTKYSEYKLDFKRQQLNEFFVAHKDEEWFKNKYHPEECAKRCEEQQSFLKKRVDVFTEVLNNGTITAITIDTNQSDKLLRLLDTVVIKLEGGTEEDLKILDEKPPEIKLPEKILEQDDDVIFTGIKQQSKSYDDTDENWDVSSPPPKPEEDENSEDEVLRAKSPKAEVIHPLKNEENNSKATKRKRSQSESSESSTDSEKSEKDHTEDKKGSNNNDDWKDEEKKSESKKVEEESENVNNSEKDRTVDSETNKDKSEDDGDDIKMKSDKKEKNDADDFEDKELMDDDNHVNATKEEDNSMKSETEEKTLEEPETIDLDTEKYNLIRPRALHRSSSIFLRNLAPVITKADIETICKRFDGFLRVAIADPLVERRWYRRGWVTFKRDVNIKEICWNLNNIRLRDCEMGAIVNRDLSRRVRPVNGITAHKTIVRNDIKICAKIAMNLDEKFKLWLDDKHEKIDSSNGINRGIDSFCFKSNNPVLQNITDFLIEEASAEEDELLGHSLMDSKSLSEGEAIERDPQLISVLDKLILYLRVVHSVDFYNHCEYPYEDEMPNRCGIIHARGPQPQNKVSTNDIQDYIKSFESKMQSFLTKASTIDAEELKNLGSKDTEAEVEKFVQANTQELGKDKWLCPLSGKKFKGPEFIRKHILNKHGEKVDEVRKEVEYFNNFLKDPKRPQLPEHPGNTRRLPAEAMPHGFRPNAYPPTYMPPYYAPPMMLPTRSSRGGFTGGRRELPPVDQQRRIIGYHDLDAPGNFDVFD